MAVMMWMGAVFTALLGVASAGSASQIDEIVLPPAEEGFFLDGTPHVLGGTQVFEYRLRGETDQRWSRAVLVVRAAHPPSVRDKMLAEAAGVAGVTAAGMGMTVKLSCREATVKVTRAAPVRGLASARLEARCPHDATTHDPVITRARTVTGQEATHMVVAMVRGKATREDEKWADRVASELTLCEAGEVKGRCAARPRAIGDPL